MNKIKAIGLLEHQIIKIHDKTINREEWINSTTMVLITVFPVSSSVKIAQIRTLSETQNHNVDITGKEKIDFRKRKAEHYLKNYIEEIELLDVENKSENICDLIKSFAFWAILISAVLLSFIGGFMMNPA